MYGDDPAICTISSDEIRAMIDAKRASLGDLARRAEDALSAASSDDARAWAGEILRDTQARCGGLTYLREHIAPGPNGNHSTYVTPNQLAGIRANLAPIDPEAIPLTPPAPERNFIGKGLALNANGPINMGAMTAEAAFRPWG